MTLPELAVRELVVNALIHQDYHVTGTGPMVEIFANRIEVTNSGAPLVDAQRFVGSAPRSRNESLAAIMRRIGICEECGSGWDKIVSECERRHLPAPLVAVMSDHTRVVLFAPRPLASMDKAERVWGGVFVQRGTHAPSVREKKARSRRCPSPLSLVAP